MTQKLALKLYKATVIALGTAVVVLLVFCYPIHDFFSFAFFAVLAIIAETQTVVLIDKSVAVSSAIIISALLVLGPGAAGLIAAASVCGSITKVEEKTYHIFNTPVTVTLFNVCNYALSIAVMSLIYVVCNGKIVTGPNESFADVLFIVNQNSIILVLSILIGIILNTLIVSTYIAIKSGGNLLRIWISNLPWTIASLFFVCLFGIIITALYVAYGWFIVVLFFAPLILARYVFVTYKDLQLNYLQTVKSLASAIEAKDAYTIGHSRRVEEYSQLIAQQMHLSPKRCETLRYAALLHDIGKIGIHEDILNKKGRLNDEEWRQIKTHPATGAHIVSDIEFLSSAVDIIKSHHEWYNGAGYPDGRDAAHLSLEAMILCAADAYDAMTSLRPYRQPLTHEQALREMYDKAGIQFSPEVVRAFDLATQKKEREQHDL